MEEKRFVSRNLDKTPQLYQSDRFVEARCLSVPETITEKSSPSLDEDNLKINAFQALTVCFSSDNKENIPSNNSVTSDESTVCAMKPFNCSDLMKFEKKLLESSNDEEKSFELKKMPVDRRKLLQLTEKLKLPDDTISTPPSALREQISMLRKEMNEAYEFHDLEIQVLKEEVKENPENSENYVRLIENYSTLLKLYSSLKSEYEEYRKDQDKIRNEFQNKTVNCLESLCSQIETSDNSLSSASFVSFSADVKSSTLIDNFIEKEATLVHDVTIQTKDPLSDTNIFKTPKFTPFKSENKCFLQNLNQQEDLYDFENRVKLTEVKTALSDKAKEIEKLEQRLFKIEDLSGLLQNEFERISRILSKENEALKESLLNKSKQLDTLTQKLYTEIISLNPHLVDSLTDAPGTKLLLVFIETIMERCKNIEDKLTAKFNNEKSLLETKVNNLEEENRNLSSQISEISALQELKSSYERQLLEIKSTILTRDEEIRILKSHNSDMKQVQEDFAKAKEEITRLESQLSFTESHKNAWEEQYLILEQKNASLRFETEKIKELYEATENDNKKLKERLSEMATDNDNLGEVCERLKLQLSEKEGVILSRDEQIQNLKNLEMKVNTALAEADAVVVGLKSELLTTESAKLNFEKRCLDLENTISTFRAEIIAKNTILKELESFKSSSESESENMKVQLTEKEMILSDLRKELDVLKQKYYMEMEQTESLKDKINCHTSEFAELEKSYRVIEKKLWDAESKIQMQEEEITILKTQDVDLRQVQEDFAKAKEEISKLESQLSFTESHKKELEKKYLHLEQTNASLRLEVEKIKELCEAMENDNKKLKERVSEMATDNDNLGEVCERLKLELSEKEGVILSRDEEIQNLKNLEMKVSTALAEADAVVVGLKSELLTTESAKLNLEKRCLDLENTISTLRAEIITKDTILKELESFKFSSESESENMKVQLTEKEMILSDLRKELDVLKQKYYVEIEKTEILKEKINCHTSEFAELEKSYGVIERKLWDAESKIQTQEEEIRTLKTQDVDLRQVQEDFASAKEIIERLEAKLVFAESEKEYLERRCQDLEEKCKNLNSNLERLKAECPNNELENENFKKLIHQKNTEIEFEGLFEILKEGLEKLKLPSMGDLSKIMKKAMVHVRKLQSRAAELKEENEKLDEECDSYAKVIKDLKKEAAVEWKKNNEKMQAFEEEISRLTEMKKGLDDEKKELLRKISKLEEEFQKLKANVTPEGRDCGCGADLKKVKELKRTILVKEQKLLELQDMEAQNNSYKSQIDYLKNALDKERKKISEEKEKNKKLQNELNEANQNQKTDFKKFEENQILEELRMRGSISGGVVGEIVDKEKMRKLSKDVGVLKEICRARYAEIKRLEAENAALKNFSPKNSNQTDSPIRSRGYCSVRSKIRVVEKWRTEMEGKENKPT